MTSQLSSIMAQLETIRDLEVLHPRALQQVAILIDRHGGSKVATALGWLYAQALYDNRLLTRQVETLRAGAR